MFFLQFQIFVSISQKLFPILRNSWSTHLIANEYTHKFIESFAEMPV